MHFTKIIKVLIGTLFLFSVNITFSQVKTIPNFAAERQNSEIKNVVATAEKAETSFKSNIKIPKIIPLLKTIRNRGTVFYINVEPTAVIVNKKRLSKDKVILTPITRSDKLVLTTATATKSN
ncbi:MULTISPECIES: hypothetical protein [unclassified Lacinutrix]